MHLLTFVYSDWGHVYYKRYIPPYVPPVDPTMAYDTQNFDETFLDMEPVLDEYNDDAMETDQEPGTDTDRTDGDENTTPSQSRSSSLRPLARKTSQLQDEDDTVDVFDGYSFKGRHSVIIDDEEEGGSEEEYESGSGDDETSSSLHTEEVQSETVTLDEAEEEVQEDGLEPKTPEARPMVLPPDDEEEARTPAAVEIEEPEAPAPKPVVEEVKKVEPKQRERTPEQEELDHDEDLAEKFALAAAVLAEQDKVQEIAKKADAHGLPATKPRAANRATRNRREKSGIPALDKDLSDGPDDEIGLTETERDEEDDDWDFIEAADGEDRNGAKATSLWARGVVDRYKLSVVFRKGSTTPGNPRTASGSSKPSQTAESTDSPSPSQRRGRTGLNFRKTPRQFLRPKSPPSTFANSNRSWSATVNSLTSGSNAPPTQSMPPSLKSKESAASMGARSVTSEKSFNPVLPVKPSTSNGVAEQQVKGSPPDQQQEKPAKTKKLKRYKNNAEKMFSIFTPSSKPQSSQS